jgi:uncharacterized protein
VRHDIRTETPLNIIFHGIEYLNSEIEDGNYFFIDILKEGIMLFDSGDFQLAVPKKLSAARRQKKAQEYFDKWFKYANSFLIDFQHGFDRKDYPKAIFELHQATEMLLMCMQLVYTDYKPKVHDLEKLDRETTKLDNRFKAIFPRETDEENACLPF